MRYDELFQLKGLEKAKLLAGKSVLEREIRGAHVAEMVEAQDWVKRGELIFVSGVAFRNVEQDLLEAIRSLSKKQVAGVVLEVGPYIQHVTDELIDLANELDLPLLSLPYEVHVSEIISQIYFDIYSKEETNKSIERFMKDLLYDDEKKALDRIELFKYDMNKKHIAIYVSIDLKDSFSSYEKKEGVLEDLLRSVRMSFVRQNQLLYLKEDDGVIAIIELEPNEKIHTVMKQKRREIERNLQYNRKNITVSMGVGNPFVNVTSVKNSVIEAKKAYKVIEKGKETSRLICYDEIGIYRVFFELTDEEVLRNLLQETLGNLIDYDKKNESDMVHTLGVFLEQNCNIAATTEALFVHRNTVKYRIKRIEEILGKDLKDVTVQFNLRLAYKILYYLA